MKLTGWKKMAGICGAVMAGVAIMLGATVIVYPAISSVAGLAVAQSSTTWNSVRDAAVGDNLTNGILATALMTYDGLNFDRLRGSIVNGILVDVTRITGATTPADGFANPTTFIGTFALNGVFNGTTWDRWRGGVMSIQGGTLFNSSNVGGANAAVVVTIAAASGQRAHLYEVSRARCTPDGVATVVVADGASQLYSANEITNQDTYSKSWSTGLTGTTNTAMTITLAACGAGNIGVLAVQADRF